MKHYIAMSGLHGCMPNVCESHETQKAAVESMASLHELGKKRTATLRRDLYLELNLSRDGNEYIEITRCDCDEPESHNDL